VDIGSADARGPGGGRPIRKDQAIPAAGRTAPAAENAAAAKSAPRAVPAPSDSADSLRSFFFPALSGKSLIFASGKFPASSSLVKELARLYAAKDSSRPRVAAEPLTKAAERALDAFRRAAKGEQADSAAGSLRRAMVLGHALTEQGFTPSPESLVALESRIMESDADGGGGGSGPAGGDSGQGDHAFSGGPKGEAAEPPMGDSSGDASSSRQGNRRDRLAEALHGALAGWDDASSPDGAGADKGFAKSGMGAARGGWTIVPFEFSMDGMNLRGFFRVLAPPGGEAVFCGAELEVDGHPYSLALGASRASLSGGPSSFAEGGAPWRDLAEGLSALGFGLEPGPGIEAEPEAGALVDDLA
jgi:hypothetical protein